MKKIIYSVAVLLACNSCLSAQEAQDDKGSRDSRSKFHVGLKAGVNQSNVYDEEGEQFAADSKTGFAGGLFFQIPIGKFLGVHPEVLISQKGFRGTGAFLGSTYEMRRTSTYLDVPVLVAFKPASFLTFVGGPQYSYLLKQTDVFMNSNVTATQDQEFQQQDIRKNILSGAVGADINIGNIVVGGRYNFDLQRNNTDGSSSAPRYKNVWWQFTAGYRF